jgi:hypothetical protein
MNCTVCNNLAAADDEYCTDCRAAIDNFRRSITGDGNCTACGRPAYLDGLCPECFDEICQSIIAHDALPRSARGGGSW